MGVFDKAKLWYNCKTSGRMQEYEDYKKTARIAKKKLNGYNETLANVTRKFINVQKRFSPDSKEYIAAKNEMNKWKEIVDTARLSLKFIRPNLREDIAYRNAQCDSFAKQLREVLSPNFDLRFHGTPICLAEQIIKSGMISSTADRYDGYIKSTDMKGEISVSDSETVQITIDIFSDMISYQRCLPGGCIFALLPKDEADATYGPSLMQSVNLRQSPGQLFGIFTTPENISRVKKWMEESGFNPDIVYTFEEFLRAVKLRTYVIDKKVEFHNRIENTVIHETPQINHQIDDMGNLNLGEPTDKDGEVR